MGAHFSHLTRIQRYQIETYLKAGVSIPKIAEEIGVHFSTVYRELKRARVVLLDSQWISHEQYSPDLAQMRYEKKWRAKAVERNYATYQDFFDFVLPWLKEDHYSPEVILQKYRALFGKTPFCLRTFYNYIEDGLIDGVSLANLPYHKKRRKRKIVLEQKRVSQGKSIDQRAEKVDSREEFGHWEMDTVYSGKSDDFSSAGILVFVERKTRRAILRWISNRKADTILQELNRLERLLSPKVFQKIFRSITTDNGSEFSRVKDLESSCLEKETRRTELYFCHSYASWQKGSVENLNRMIRRFFPKQTRFGRIGKEKIQEVEDWLNAYPRRVLGWKSAKEIWLEEMKILK